MDKREYNMKPQTSHACIETYSSLVGPISVACTDKHVISICIGDESKTNIINEVEQLGFEADHQANTLTHKMMKELQEYFNGKRKRFTLKPQMFGTPFQVIVWEALQEVPFGQILSYGELATKIGKPKAARAVGNAMGKNRIPILIPCHRVVANGGKLGGFGCGLPVKRKLLEIEHIELD